MIPTLPMHYMPWPACCISTTIASALYLGSVSHHEIVCHVFGSHPFLRSQLLKAMTYFHRRLLLSSVRLATQIRPPANFLRICPNCHFYGFAFASERRIRQSSPSLKLYLRRTYFVASSFILRLVILYS